MMGEKQTFSYNQIFSSFDSLAYSCLANPMGGGAW